MTPNTNRQLWSDHRELQNIKSSIIYRALKKVFIDEFYAQNGPRIEIIQKKVKEMNEEFFVIIDGRIKMIEEKGQQPRASYKVGKTKEEYNKAYNALMDETYTDIIII